MTPDEWKSELLRRFDRDGVVGISMGEVPSGVVVYPTTSTVHLWVYDYRGPAAHVVFSRGKARELAKLLRRAALGGDA